VARLLLAVRAGRTLSPVENSELLLACSPLLDDVIAELFGIRKEIDAARGAVLAHNPVFSFKNCSCSARTPPPDQERGIRTFARARCWLSSALQQAAPIANLRCTLCRETARG